MVVVEFASGTRLFRERDRASQFSIVGNGPPGTFVIFPDGLRVSLPTDQIVTADDASGRTRVGFGGMAFVGVEGRHLTFRRVRELHPVERLSPARSHVMTLDTLWVTQVVSEGLRVWPTPA